MEAPSAEDRVFELLHRADKYYLGGGDGVIFAPPLPLWLDRPGFWDGVHYFLFGFSPAFTITVTDRIGRACPLHLRSRRWTPAELDARYTGPGIELRERRVILPGARVISECTLANPGTAAVDVTLVAWTAQEGADLRDRAGIAGGADAVHFAVVTHDAQGGGLELELGATLSAPGAQASCIAESQHMRSYPNPPDWSITPFVDHWVGSRLDGTVRHALEPPAAGRTVVYLGVSRPLTLAPGTSVTVPVTLQLQPVAAALRLRTAPAPAGRAPETAVAASYHGWAAFFREAPALACTDPWLERYFAYRWYGLRLNFLDPAGDYTRPTVAEGPEYFHAAVSYSAWCHMRELRWLADPARARGALHSFLDRQRPDGSLPGILYLRGEHPTAFYIADWGGSLDALQEVHPDPAFLAECYEPLTRFARFMREQRDADDSGMYDVRDPYETGQETMSRYTAVDPDADRQHFSNRLRLKGIDSTVYMYRLHRALARAAATLGDEPGLRLHDTIADRIAAAVRAHMWDPRTGLFSDVDPDHGRRTGIRAAVCFYPFLTDIAGPEHVWGLYQHLFDETSFWLPWPVPSTAASDATFSPRAEWQGVRQSCPWNGRVWPMTNAHVVEALATAALTLDDSLRGRTAELFTMFLRMLFFDGDPAQPNCFEHYSPLTGQPSLYRGLDDYQHSWINDLIIRYVAGFRPTTDGFVLDPFPFEVDQLRLERLPFRGHSIAIELDERTARAHVDGYAYETVRGAALQVRVR